MMMMTIVMIKKVQRLHKIGPSSLIRCYFVRFVYDAVIYVLPQVITQHDYSETRVLHVPISHSTLLRVLA